MTTKTKTKAQRQSDANFDTAVEWLLQKVTLDLEQTFHAITQGWITEEEANSGMTVDGRDVDEVIAERRAAERA